jgi:hypothetical protein
MKSTKRSLIIFAVLGLLSANAYATPPGSTGTVCNGSGSCGDSSNTNPGNNYANSSSASQAFGVGIGVGVGGNSASNSSSTASNGSVTADIETSNLNTNSNSNATSNSNNSSNSSTVSVAGDKFEAANIPVGGSIAAGANGTSSCLKYKSWSANGFFISGAKAGHETDFICLANEMGMPEVATQLACDTDSGFKKAFNKIAAKNETAACIE